MKKFLLTLSIALCFVLSVNGQALDITHFMRISPFQHNNLPSSSTIYNGYFSLPTGNIQAGVNLGAIRYNNLFETNEQGYPTVLTATKFVNSLAKKNNLGVYTDAELLGFGFRIKDRFFLSVDYRLRANLDFSYSRDVLGLPIYGNMAYVDKPADMSMGINMDAYQEIGVSFRHEVDDRISWGVRPRILFGLANVNTQSLSAQVSTDPKDYTISIAYEAAMRAAAVVPFTMLFDQENGFQFEVDDDYMRIPKNAFKNLGFGMDLGFSYKVMKSLNLSAALLDLGFINWKTSTTSLTSNLDDAGSMYQDGSLKFSGLSKEQIEALLNGQNIDGTLDTLAQYFPMDIAPTGKYTTALTPRMVLQADYEFAKHHRVSAAAQFRFAKNYFQPSLTLAYDGLFFNVIDICVAYTMQRRSFDNLGVGIGLNLGYLNLYAGTQNIIAAFTLKNASQVTATAGVVFNWGHFDNWRAKNQKKMKHLDPNIP